ncbi:hypothetical protein E8E13_010991 [Curvularia kusanoi]|uniref:Uncharacterized protein n=1 Tax=Curvularia kusanoi TaxID=90978 RepID=A0A9P4WCR6_CURKU|nr:hypothetical protein E8E13_010991 [Curvularia kusanoi]
MTCPSGPSDKPIARIFTIMALPSSILPTATPVQQTKLLGLHSPPTSTLSSNPSPVPKMTINSLVLFTPSPSPSAEPGVTILTFPFPDPLPATSHPSAPVPSALTAGAIAGISIGIIAILTALAFFAFFFYRRHNRNKPQPDTEKLDVDAMIEARIQRARDMASKRWSQRQTIANRKRFEALKAKEKRNEKEMGVREIAKGKMVGNMETKKVDGDE